MANYTVNAPRTIPAIEAELNKIKTAIDSHLDRNPASGQANQMEADLDMNSNQITNLAAGTAATDAVNKSQLDTAVASVEVSSIAHIDEYVGTEATTILDVEAACDAVEKVYFGGTDITVDGDVTIDSGAAVLEWDLQNSTFTLEDNAQLLVTKDYFILRNGTINGGLKQATVSTASGSTPSTLTVTDASQFSAGGHVSASWSNGYLPNSTGKSSLPSSVLNTISGIASNVITLDYSVDVTISTGGGNIIPEGAKLFNARFDKSGTQFTGSGTFIFENVHFTNFANAYFVDIVDSTESAKVLFRNCTFDNIALDCFKFRAGQVVFDNCFVDTPLDIAKQTIVWANTSDNGQLGIRDTIMKNSSRDSFLFGFADSGTTSKCPDVYIQNSTFDGTATMDFTPNQLYKDAMCLHWISYSGSLTDVDVGRFTAVNSRFLQFERSILGTTFAEPSSSYTMGEVVFDNCFIDGTPVVVQGSTSTGNRVTINASEIRHSGSIASTFMEGIEDYTCINCKLRDNFPDSGTFTEAGATTTADYPRRSFIERTDTHRRYTSIVSAGTTSGDSLTDDTKFFELKINVANGNFIDCEFNDKYIFLDEDTYFERCKFNYISDATNDRKPIFNNFRQGQLNGGIVLKGYDPTDSTLIDTDSFFLTNIEPDNLVELDLPIIDIEVEETNARLRFGGNESSGENYHYVYEGIRSDPSVGITAPLSYKGAFMYKPYTGSVVHYARDRATREIHTVEDKVMQAISSPTATESSDTTTANYSAGDTINQTTSGKDYVAITNTTSGDDLTDTTKFAPALEEVSGSGTINLGDWIGANVSGESRAYFYEVVYINGSTIGIRSDIDETYTSSDNFTLIKHKLQTPVNESLRLVLDNGTANYTASTWNTLSFFSTERNEIHYASVASATTITLPSGKYIFSCFVHAETQTATTSAQNFQGSLRLSSTLSGWTDIQGATAFHQKDTTSNAIDQHIRPSVEGSFETEEEADFTIEFRPSVAATVTGTSNQHGAVLTITKVG